MTTIRISLPDDRAQKLRDMASRFQVTPEDLLRVSLEELLARPDEEFQEAVRHVLAKNVDLYRRLA
jgi:predicted transcriptional regulator